MKKIYLLLLTFCPFVGFGQEVFTRFTTQDASKPTATADVQVLTQTDLLLDKVDVSALLATDRKEEVYASLNSEPVVSRERCNFHYLMTEK